MEKLTWAEQLEKGELQDPSLSYVPFEAMSLEPVETMSLEPAGEHVHISHGNKTNYMFLISNLEPLVISYQANQPANP